MSPRPQKQKRRAKRSRTPRPPPAPLDPVTQYARAVVDGQVVAGRAVRLAGARHLRNLDQQRTEAFPYYFDAAAAEHFINFCPTFLTIYDGRPFVLPAWLQFAFGSLFGWKRVSDGCRRFTGEYLETAKGSVKTPGGAAVVLYCLAFDDEQSGEIYSAGFDKGQGSLVLNDAIKMATDSPDLSEILEIGAHNIAHVASNSFARAVSSEHRSKSGPRPSVVIVDEEHEHRGPTVINKLIAGFKFRPQPILVILTNSGHDRTSICWQHHEKSLQVLEQVVNDETWFAYVCHLDPCDACYADGYRQPKDGCKTCDDWTDLAVAPKANPALPDLGLPGVAYLQRQIDTALSMPSDRALIQRLNSCIWTETHQVWIAPDDWAACAPRDHVPAQAHEGRACAAAFDMSEKLDLTSCVVALRVPDEPTRRADTVELLDREGDDEVTKTLNIDFCVELIPFFWLPEETLVKRVKNERIPFDVWARTPSVAAPYLRVCPGPLVDQNLIQEQFVQDIGKRYRPDRVGYDKYNATTFMLQLRDKFKYTVVEVAQGRALSEAFKLFYALVRLKRILHNGNPVMGWCVSNAEPKRDRYENLWIEKPSQTKRIDGLIAAVIALSQLVLLPARRRTKHKGARVYTPSGFVPAIPPTTAPGVGGVPPG
jgi:phage terminase large subunit-like protein